MTGSGFHVILEGEAAVVVDGTERARIGRGEFFGEVSILLGESPIADVVALGTLRCLVLSGPGGGGVPDRSTRASCTGCSRSRPVACAPRTDGGADPTVPAGRLPVRRRRQRAGRAPGVVLAPADTGSTHAVISSDPSPGGMFRRWPHFQRLLSWTKPFAPVARGTRAYERYDWNSLLADEPEATALQPGLMDGSSYFPSRPEMEANLAAFADRAVDRRPLRLRLDRDRARAEGADGVRFTVETADGAYTCRVLVVAVGVAQPFTPPGPRDGVQPPLRGRPCRPRPMPAAASSSSASRTPGSSSPTACCRGLASSCSCRRPTPSSRWTRGRWSASGRATSSRTRTTSWAAASPSWMRRWIASSARRGRRPPRVAAAHGRRRRTWPSRSMTSSRRPGFVSPARQDLPELGVATFGQSRLPVQTPWWESATVPGIRFAGTIGQGAKGLQRHGVPSNSGAVHGARYNAQVLAADIAARDFGHVADRPAIAPDDARRLRRPRAGRCAGAVPPARLPGAGPHVDPAGGFRRRRRPAAGPRPGCRRRGRDRGDARGRWVGGHLPGPVSRASAGATTDHVIEPDLLMRYDTPATRRASPTVDGSGRPAQLTGA